MFAQNCIQRERERERERVLTAATTPHCVSCIIIVCHHNNIMCIIILLFYYTNINVYRVLLLLRLLHALISSHPPPRRGVERSTNKRLLVDRFVLFFHSTSSYAFTHIREILVQYIIVLFFYVSNANANFIFIYKLQISYCLHNYQLSSVLLVKPHCSNGHVFDSRRVLYVHL